MDALSLEYRVVSDTEAEIYGKPAVTGLVLALAKEGCEVTALTERDESLESYYVNLIGGEAHE